MQELDDNRLLRKYSENNSEEAFAALVARHINKVYSTALRHTHNPGEAEEITQAVFVILAKKARHLGKKVVISGWLYQTARLASVTYLRSEIRRARREQEAHTMQSILNEPDESWTQMAPLLDAAMAGLNETDRHAVVLRFFDGKNLREVGTALGTTEDAAKKRLSRALEKLQRFFSKRGVHSTTAIIAGAISGNSVQAAPVALAKSVTAAALTQGTAAGSSTLSLVKGALKAMAWTKAKTTIVAVVGILLIAGVGALMVEDDLAANLKAQNLYVVEENGSLSQTTQHPTIGVYRLDGSTVNDSLISGVDMPQSIAISGHDMFVSNGSDTIAEYTTSGQLVNASLVKKGLHQAWGIAISGNDLFVLDYSPYAGYTVREYTTSGQTLNASLISRVDYPFIAISGNDLFVETGNSIGEYTTSGKVIHASLISVANPSCIAISGKKMFVADYNAGSIGEYTTSGKTLNASLISGLHGPIGIAISGTKLFVVNASQAGRNGSVGEYTTSGATINASLISGLIDPEGIAIH